MDSQKIPDYVAEILARIAQENGFSDYSFNVNPGCKPGDGYLSDLYRITISNEQNNSHKMDVVCKVAPSNENSEMDSFVVDAFKNEALFYTKSMPILTKFQEEMNIPKDEQFRSLPKCFATLIDEERGRYVIILEDLRPYGFQMCGKSKLTPISNLRLIVRELGKFHGLSIAMKDQRPDEFAIAKPTKDMLKTSFEMKTIFEIFMSTFDHSINSLKKEHHKSIMQYLKTNALKYIEFCLNEELTDDLAVLCHGKLHFVSIL